jgi:hypothetical protein
MTLKYLLKSDFGVDLHISGGSGNSIENPIVIHRTDLNDYTSTEHLILKCLGIRRKIEWKILEQLLISQDEKKFDKIRIETKEMTDSEIITQIENYYFDITECFGNEVKQEKTFNEKDVLEKIKKRLIKLASVSEFNLNCIYLLKNGELFKDTNLTIEFLDVIMNDESFPLFESMMENTKKPIMVVLRIIGKEL